MDFRIDHPLRAGSPHVTRNRGPCPRELAWSFERGLGPTRTAWGESASAGTAVEAAQRWGGNSGKGWGLRKGERELVGKEGWGGG